MTSVVTFVVGIIVGVILGAGFWVFQRRSLVDDKKPKLTKSKQREAQLRSFAFAPHFFHRKQLRDLALDLQARHPDHRAH